MIFKRTGKGHKEIRNTLKEASRLVRGVVCGAIELPKGTGQDIDFEFEEGVEYVSILRGLYRLEAEKTAILFCLDPGYAIMVNILDIDHPRLGEVETKDMILMSCVSDEELLEEMRKTSPDIRSDDVVTVINWRCIKVLT